MKKKRVLALLMMLTLIFVSLPEAGISAADKGSIEGIDYSRINVSDMASGFPASVRFGKVSIRGRLRYSGHLDSNQIDEYISKFMDEYDIDSDDLVEAQEALDKYRYLEEVSDEDSETCIGRIASIAGYGLETSVVIDAGKQVIKGDFSLSGDAWKNTLSNFSSPLKAADTVISFIIGKVTANPYIKFIMTLKDTVVVSWQAYQDYVDKWETRVEGMVAVRALDEFYRRVNLYIDSQAVKDRVFPADAKWMLQINGERDRMFTFMGIPGNIQHWKVALNMEKEVDYSGKGGPAGGYSGPMEIELTHDMTPFSNWVFDIRVGSLKPLWYRTCEALMFDGKHVYDCSQSGSIDIYRFLCNANAKMDIYSDRISGATLTGSSGIVQTSIYLGNFDSSQYVGSSKKATIKTAIGFLDSNNILAGYTQVDSAYHVEGGYEDSMSIYIDKGYADANVINLIKYKTNVYTQKLATFWDKNIWAPLEGNSAKVIIRLK